MSFNIDGLLEQLRSERETFEDNSKIVPAPLEYDHFRGIEEIREIGDVLLIESEKDLHKWLSDAIEAKRGKEKKKLYRGHGDASWLTVSTIYREAKDNDANFRKLEESHHEYVKELLKNRPGISNNEQVLAYAQHYGKHSTLIDFTFNPLIALYFATARDAVENVDSELQYYFSVIELTETTMFANWEKALDITLGNFLSDEDDRPEKIVAFKSAMGNSVVEALQKMNNPVWIAESEGREISNPRMRAQEGAFLYQCKHANVPFEAEVKAIKNDPLKKDMIKIRYVLISRKLFLKVREILEDYRINAHTLLLGGPHGWIENNSSKALEGFVNNQKSVNLINDALYFLQYNPCPQSFNLFRSSLYLAKIVEIDDATEDVEWDTCPWFSGDFNDPKLIDKIRYLIQFCIPDKLVQKELGQILKFAEEIDGFCDKLRSSLTADHDLTKMMSTRSVKAEFNNIVEQVFSYMHLKDSIKTFISDTIISVVSDAFSDMICDGDFRYNNGNQYGQLEDVDNIEIISFMPEGASLNLWIRAYASIIPVESLRDEEANSESMEFTSHVRVSFDGDKVLCEQLSDLEFY